MKRTDIYQVYHPELDTNLPYFLIFKGGNDAPETAAVHKVKGHVTVKFIVT